MSKKLNKKIEPVTETVTRDPDPIVALRDVCAALVPLKNYHERRKVLEAAGLLMNLFP